MTAEYLPDSAPNTRVQHYRRNEWRDPQGLAQSDYRNPCPWCDRPPGKGDEVRRVEGRWWHEECRAAYRHALGLQL